MFDFRASCDGDDGGISEEVDCSVNVVSLRLCSLGAMLTSVFVVSNPALPFDAGSRLAKLGTSFERE